jgi:hypothetical protein
MKNLVVSFILFLVSLTSVGQSINSTAVLKDLKVIYAVNDSIKDEYPVRSVNVTVNVTQDSIVMVGEYPKHASVTYKVISSQIVEDDVSHFDCVSSGGDSVHIVYGSLDYDVNKVLFIVSFKKEDYYYTGIKQ